MTVAPSASSIDAVGVMTALDSSLSSGMSNWNSPRSALSLSRARALHFLGEHRHHALIINRLLCLPSLPYERPPLRISVSPLLAR